MLETLKTFIWELWALQILGLKMVLREIHRVFNMGKGNRNIRNFEYFIWELWALEIGTRILNFGGV